MSRTLLDLLDRAVTRYGDRPALGVGTTTAPPRAGPIASSTGAHASRPGDCGRSTSSPATGS